MDELSAIRMARKGDQRACAGLVGHYKHMVYTVCHRILRQREDAQEATQDTFVKAFRHLDEYHGEARFSTWLYSIAYRTALSKLRGRKEGGSDLDALSGATQEPWQPPDAAVDDRKAILDRALAQLPPEDAAIMTFYYLQELSVEEIVTITGLGVSNVKVRLHRARKRLLVILQDHLKEETWTLTMD